MKSDSNDMQARSRATSSKGAGDTEGEEPDTAGSSKFRPAIDFLKERDRLLLELTKSAEAAKEGKESWMDVACEAHRLLNHLVGGLPWSERDVVAFVVSAMRNRG